MNARITRAGLLAVVCGLSSGAWGQNALDRPLDRNTLKGSGGINSARPNFAEEVRFRNAIITGNAPGGISFRGDVGYRAPGEFLSNLPSNQNFAFRRDSFYSGLGGMGIRGTDALQYQFAMTTGNNPPQALSGFSGIYGRGFAGASVGEVRTGTAEEIPGGGGGAPRSVRDDGPALEQGADLLSARSLSSFIANRGLQPTLMGTAQDQSGKPFAVNASVLRGLSFDEVPGARPREGQAASTGAQAVGIEGLRGPEERTRPASPTSLNPPTPENQLDAGAAKTGAENKLDPGRVQPRTPYDDLVERLKGAAGATGATGASGATGGTGADAEPLWQQRLNEMRQALSDRQGAMAATGAVRPGQRRPAAGEPGATGATGATGTVTSPRSPEEKAKDRKDSRILPPEALRMLRDSAGKMITLAPSTFDAYGTNMKAGQEHLAAGRFFDAEERFAAALGAKAGDPLAAVGRVHAELGAGMFMSAAINLRALLVDHPELAAQKYAPELLPSKERMAGAISRLHELSGEGGGRDPGLLLAYLGYQAGDDAALKRGLEVMETAPAGGTEDQLTRLAVLLREVWTKAPAPAGAPDGK